MNTEKPKRRPRYRGKNPRHFSEKYKEHAPERYADDVAKVIASGKTPAGTHRPVMVREIMEVLAPQARRTCRGLHARLRRPCGCAPRGPAARRPAYRPRRRSHRTAENRSPAARLGFGPDTLTVHRTNFAGLARVLPEPADIIFADLGLSSMQIDNPARGFTYKYDGPLDLRMNPQRGQTASALLASLDEPAPRRSADRKRRRTRRRSHRASHPAGIRVNDDATRRSRFAAPEETKTPCAAFSRRCESP